MTRYRYRRWLPLPPRRPKPTLEQLVPVTCLSAAIAFVALLFPMTGP